MTANPDGSGSIRALAAQLPVANVQQALVEDSASGLILIVGGVQTANRVIAFDPLIEQIWETQLLLPEQRERPGAVYSAATRQGLAVEGNATFAGGLKNTVWRIPFGDGPAVPIGRWDFPPPVASSVTSIHSDEDGVTIGTSATGVGLFRPGGTMTSYGGVLSTLDVRWSPAFSRLWMVRSERAVVRSVNPDTVLTMLVGELPDTTQLATLDFAPNIQLSFRGVRDNPRFEPILGAYRQDGSGEFASSSPRLIYRAFTDLSFLGSARFNVIPSTLNRVVPAVAHRGVHDVSLIVRDTFANQNAGTLQRMQYSYLRVTGGELFSDHGHRCGAENVRSTGPRLACR